MGSDILRSAILTFGLRFRLMHEQGPPDYEQLHREAQCHSVTLDEADMSHSTKPGRCSEIRLHREISSEARRDWKKQTFVVSSTLFIQRHTKNIFQSHGTPDHSLL
jgi:hypothetical protein